MMKRQRELIPALDCIIDLLSKEGAWCQAAFAKTVNGDSIGALSPNATCWCLAGAVTKCTVPSIIPDVQLVIASTITITVDDIPVMDMLMAFNDAPGRSQKQIVDTLKRARENAPLVMER